ncbi:vegetative cell wall protein gp1 isoform X2 [Brachypodium distachyon]|uniref:Uncharacterized protein n=2 Tax=Brachypodium distachyon TaxID=15368 RepID=A0A0Q3S3R8_BRADI|nr:vegetative cell wall protein gp1 isoform X2 [Brachypodium distachyon]KQK19866.1 hypothetical protein BRADI_1g50960v3 [Brachypodium distachyon]|eukprot:XP_014756156.1 vegetative cell wall protein gp1 isoform X2 [Brachypodium distachyon]
MASPPQRPPAAAPPTVASAPPATAPQPLPRAFPAASAPPRAAAAATPTPPPLFTGRPLNPSHASPAHGIFYPVATTSSSAAALANQRRAPNAGYPRAQAVAVPVAPSQQLQMQTQPQSFAAVSRAVVAGVTPRPEQPPRGVPIAPQPHPKVNPVAAVTPSPQHEEHSNTKQRESTKEDSTTVVVINDRKVNLLDSESGSLYALCRSWVRNGVQHEIQNDTGEYTAADLLKQHVNRAKKIRARLRKGRQSRIERYKQRLAFLLPPPPSPPTEPGKHDGRP